MTQGRLHVFHIYFIVEPISTWSIDETYLFINIQHYIVVVISLLNFELIDIWGLNIYLSILIYNGHVALYQIKVTFYWLNYQEMYYYLYSYQTFPTKTNWYMTLKISQTNRTQIQFRNGPTRTAIDKLLYQYSFNI